MRPCPTIDTSITLSFRILRGRVGWVMAAAYVPTSSLTALVPHSPFTCSHAAPHWAMRWSQLWVINRITASSKNLLYRSGSFDSWVHWISFPESRNSFPNSSLFIAFGHEKIRIIVICEPRFSRPGLPSHAQGEKGSRVSEVHWKPRIPTKWNCALVQF